ncbi:MAG: TraB/GumN family protein [Nanoarchaeota archaeon]|nr:TraB/GumN family protein [Nanoarchaeota archaeon]MBU1321134.1 TraB/GumN family protein [Nanoarchaeota archaeon]MBU1597965.1 TraB/GumN family protein [Nanoarchaeota archaeon]MBU2441810.1 TraB/GumN family protein [Nanoarchaeota archaeon]
MLKYKNIIIIGTSHIAKSSLKEIESVFFKQDPEIVAVELDKSRLHALLENKKPDYSLALIPQIGLQGYLFAVIGAFLQKKLGNIVGITPGSDMLKAVTLARDNQKRIALIDRDIRITLSRLSKAIKWKEKINFLIDIFRAPFSEKMKIDLKKVPEKEIITKALGLLKKRYPGIYAALVDERNKIMALKINALMENYPDKKILVVVGAGHEEDLLDLVKKGLSQKKAI